MVYKIRVLWCIVSHDGSTSRFTISSVSTHSLGSSNTLDGMCIGLSTAPCAPCFAALSASSLWPLRRYAACSASASARPSTALVSPESFPPDLPGQLPRFIELSSSPDLPALGWFVASPLRTLLLVQLSLSRLLSIVFTIDISRVTASLPLPLHLSFILLQSYCLTSRSTVHLFVSSLLATEAGNAVAICAMAEDTSAK